MTTMNTYTQKAVKQQLSDVVKMLDVSETPFLSMIGEEKIGGRTAEWAEDSLRAPGANAQTEGAAAGQGNHAPLVERTNYTQIFSDTVNVSGSAAVNEQAGKNELARQRQNVAKALKLDIEYAFVGTAQVAAVGDASNPRKLGGFQSQIDAGNIKDLAGAGFNEDTIADFLADVYVAGGKPSVIMAHPRLIRTLSKALKAEKMTGVNNDTSVVSAVYEYVSDFGTVKLVPNRYCRYNGTEADVGGVKAKSGDILFIDPTMWKTVIFRDWSKEALGKKGDSIEELMVTELTLKNMNQKSSGLMTNVKSAVVA